MPGEVGEASRKQAARPRVSLHCQAQAGACPQEAPVTSPGQPGPPAGNCPRLGCQSRVFNVKNKQSSPRMRGR